MAREELEAGLGRGRYAVGVEWDEGSMVHGACNEEIRRTDDRMEVWGWVDRCLPPPWGGRATHTQPTYYQHRG